ncbi:MAG TPA: ATP-binding protein [Ktedonobacterales bacterium]
MSQPRILIVDDDAALLEALPTALQIRMPDTGVDTCDSALAALEKIAQTDYDAIVSDIKMPEMDGLALLGKIHSLRPDTPTLLITGHGEHDLAIQALRGAAYDFIQKPIDRDYFVASLSRAIQVRKLRRQVEEQRLALEQHAAHLEQTVRERTRELVAANAAKDELLRARDSALIEAEAASRRLSNLQIIADVALAHLSLDGLLPELLQRARDVLSVDAVTIMLKSDDTDELIVRATLGLEDVFTSGTRIPFGVGLAGRIAVTHEAMLVDDVSKEQVFNPRLKESMRSVVGAPLLVDGRLIGVIQCGARKRRRFTQDDASLLHLAADRIALAIDHARLYQEAQDRTREQREARRQVEKLAAELGQRAAELNTIFEAMPGAVYVCDASGQLVRVNEQGVTMVGMEDGEKLRHIETLSQQEELYRLDGTPMPLEEYPLYQALDGITQTNVRFFMRHHGTGKQVPVQFSASPIRDEQGMIIGAVGIAADITELYSLERQKDEFLGIASHELKTPLTSLKGLTQLTRRRLERSGAPEAQYLARMEYAIRRMETLVNDLLDISRIESGKLALRLEPCEFIALCRQVVDEQVAATDRHIIFEAPAEPIEIEVDIDRISQVLTNLLSNSLKYSPLGSPVTLTITPQDGHVGFTVRDQGTGIPEVELPHIFERFYRVPGVEVQSGSGVGLGLGLYITKEIVERHGGHISVESKCGKGSAFHVSLPLVAPMEAGESPLASSTVARSAVARDDAQS